MRKPVSVAAGVPTVGRRPTLVNGLPYPHPTSIDVTKRMRRNMRTDTHPEIIVRSELHRKGLRFRKDLPLRLPNRIVRPDIVFTRAKLAVFIDGCFWHVCPIHGNQPRANTDYWRPKLAINVARDLAIDEELTTSGWRVLRAWEHEHPVDVSARVLQTLAVSHVS
jgi:DNA mismatch endonuclease, patch repair protein